MDPEKRALLGVPDATFQGYHSGHWDRSPWCTAECTYVAAKGLVCSTRGRARRRSFPWPRLCRYRPIAPAPVWGLTSRGFMSIRWKAKSKGSRVVTQFTGTSCKWCIWKRKSISVSTRLTHIWAGAVDSDILNNVNSIKWHSETSYEM